MSLSLSLAPASFVSFLHPANQGGSRSFLIPKMPMGLSRASAYLAAVQVSRSLLDSVVKAEQNW